MKQRFCSGSVSIFYVLILVGLISVLFAFLEAARVSALKTNVHLLTGQAEDAVYASYQPELWEQYHLLFWEESGEGNTGTFPQFTERCGRAKLGKPAVWTQFFLPAGSLQQSRGGTVSTGNG